MRLTAGDVCAITGTHQKALERLVAAGHLPPLDAVTGTGNHRSFTRGQALAIFAGAAWRAEGAAPDRVAGLIRFLAILGVERLEAEIEAGRSFPVPATMLGDVCLPGLMIEPPPDNPALGHRIRAAMRRLDMRTILFNFERRLKEVAAQATTKGKGRRSGLGRVKSKR